MLTNGSFLAYKYNPNKQIAINSCFFTSSSHFYRTVSGSKMLTLAGTLVDVCGDAMKEMFKSRCKVFMQLDRGKIILNKTGQIIFISKKALGKRHLHNGKTYPRCNSSPDIMGITGKFEPCFYTWFSIREVKCRSRYSSTRDRMTREYHTSDDVRVARALARDTCAERVFWWHRKKFGFKVYSERSFFSRDLITTMSSRITVTNVCLIQWDNSIFFSDTTNRDQGGAVGDY